jgi:hypothetical protein
MRRKSRALIPALILTYCTIQIAFVGSRFGTNDDVGMSQIASGGFTGKPSEHLIFINPLIGFLLKWLYIVSPPIPWYSVLIILSLVFSLSIFIDLLLKRLEYADTYTQISFLMISFLVLFPTFANRIFEINYSGTAYFCSIIGFSAWILSLNDTADYTSIGPLISCFIGFLWRDFAFYSVIPIFVILFYFCHRRDSLKKYLKNFVLLGSMLLVGTMGALFSRYSSKDWKAFYELNGLRGKLHGNVVIDSLIQNQGMQYVSKLSGISQLNLDFFFGWFVSYDVMEKSSLQKLVEVISNNSSFGSFHLGSLALAESRGSSVIYLVIFSALLIYGSAFKLRYLLASVFIICFQLIAISYLEIYVRTPSYVVDSFQFGVALAAFLLFLSQIHIFDTTNKRRPFVIVGLVPVFCVFIFAFVVKFGELTSDFNKARIAQAQFDKDLLSFENKLKEPAIALGAPVELSNVDPWSSFKMTRIPILTLGWAMSSPLEQERLAFFGVNSDLNQALLHGELSVLTSIGSNTEFQVQRYLVTNFGACLDVESEILSGTNYVVSRFIPSNLCESGVFTSAPLTSEVFLTDRNFSVFITNCVESTKSRIVGLDLHSPFGVFAKPFQIELNYMGRNSAPTKLLYTIEPGGVNGLEIETYGCEIDVRSISNGVIPNLLDKKNTDARNLYFGVSKVSLISD